MTTYRVLGLPLESNVPLPRLEPASLPERRIQLRCGETFPLDARWQVVSEAQVQDDEGRPVVALDRETEHGTYRFRWADGVTACISASGWHIGLAWEPRSTFEDAVIYLLGSVMGFVLRLHGLVALHAGCVVIEGHAVALAGGSGAGKSTLTAAFADLGYAVLSDDITAMRPREGEILVQPDAPMIRLWPKAATLLFGDADAELPPLVAGWEKRFLHLGSPDAEPRFEAATQPFPLAAVYLLDGTDGPASPSIEVVPPARALIELVGASFGAAVIDPAMRRREFEVLGTVAEQSDVKQVYGSQSVKPRELAALVAADVSPSRKQADGATG